MSAALLAQGPGERTKVQGFSDAGKAALSKQIADAVSRGDTPGVVEIVVNRDGVLYEGAAGKFDVAKNVPMPTNAIFQIASMTKPVTSVAIMMLLEQGKLKLDDPVSKYLTGYDNLQVITKFNAADATYETRPAKTAMTIRHLLAHTSGIGYGFTNPIENALTAKTKKGEWELPLLDDPGTKWNYSRQHPRPRLHRREGDRRRARALVSGAHLQAARHGGHVVRRRGGQAVAHADATTAASRARWSSSRGRRFRRRRRRRSAATAASTPPSRTTRSSCACCSTTARSGPAKILTPASVKMMGQNQIGSIFVERQPDADKQRTKPFPLGAGKDKFGLGFQIASNDPAMAKFRSPGSLSWAGIFNTEFWVDPVKHIGAVQMMQVLPFYDDGAIRTLRDFEETVYKNLP